MTICNIVIAYYNNNNFIKLLDIFEKEFSYTFNATIYFKLKNRGRNRNIYLIHQGIEEGIGTYQYI